MQRLRRMLDRLQPLFLPGGKFERYHALFEMVDTLFYSPPDLTRGAPHVRDAVDLKRVMIMVVFAATPCALIGMWNTGFQANTAMTNEGFGPLPGWHEAAVMFLGAGGHDPSSLYDNFVFGLVYFLPIYAVTLLAGGFWEVLFAGIRNHEVNEGFLVTSFLYALILPATLPLWQVALGISFGVVIGKEVFGGTGKNVFNPALVGRAFLFFAYPAQISGDTVWTAVMSVDSISSATVLQPAWTAAEGFTGATPLAAGAGAGMSGITSTGLTWLQAFLGQHEGSLGSTSVIACLFGAAVLVYAGIASWRVIVACFLGLIIPVIVVNHMNPTDPMMAVPWYWHIVIGGFTFGAVFMATDPVTSAQTNTGRWVYGFLIGFLTFVIRVLNPAYREGIMLAILFGNAFAPLIDHFVVQANIRRRLRRNV